MKDAFELAYRYVIPSLRGLLVRELHRAGIQESIIADILGISRSAVTRYIKKERGRYTNLIKFDEIVPVIKEISRDVAEKRIFPQEIHLRMFEVAANLMSRKRLCRLHKKIDPSIDVANCKVCPTIFREVMLQS